MPTGHTPGDDYFGSDCVGVYWPIGLMLVLLVQGKWTSMDSWFVAVLASAVMAMVIGQYVNQMGLLGLW